jgi:ABC-type transport system involved in multi-copper enzyme maturation permease subunit
MNGEWRLWRAQLAGILRLELKKSFFSRRAWWIYLVAALPPLLTWMHSIYVMNRGRSGCTIGEDGMIFASIFQLYYLRLALFFGCLGIFSNLFRGEVLEKTLHYYFLAPVRREVLLAGKYVAGLVAAGTLFSISVALAFFGIFTHFGQSFQDFLWSGPGLEQLLWYVVVTALGAVGYGAVFTTVGLMFRNPMIPAAAVLVWEGINSFLPAFLQKISVLFYLKTLCPVQVPLQGPLAIIAVVSDPVPAWLAVPGLLLVSLLVLAYAAVKAREMEVSYSE